MAAWEQVLAPPGVHRAAGAVAAGLGRVTGAALRAARFLPGVAGAGLASYGTWLAYRPAGIILAGILLLAADRQIALRRGGNGR